MQVAWGFKKSILEALISWSEITGKLNKLKGRYFVYLLIKNESVVYVGRSQNLFCRLSYHKYRKDFDKIYISEYENLKDCCQEEKEITKFYQPILNRLWVLYGK